MMSTREHIPDGRLYAIQNNGLRTPEMNRARIPDGLVVDARKKDTHLWERLAHGAVPLKPANSIEGIIIASAVDQWKKDLGDDLLVLFVPTIGTAKPVEYSWGPVRREDLDREPAVLKYIATTVKPASLRGLSVMVAYEAITGISFYAPPEKPVVLSGQLVYDA